MDLFPGNGRYCGLYNINFNINENDKVVDIGGGINPFPRSTHVIDKSDSNNNNQRHNRNIKIGRREFLDGDASEILKQFPDKYFDFCYSSHTFEHIVNLTETIDLINKKCKRGFYALPATDFELFTTEEHYGHVNLCRLITDTLHICKRPKESIIDIMGKHYAWLCKNNPDFLKIWADRYRFIWECRHYWEEEIKYCFYENPEALYPQLKYFNKE